MQGAGCHEQHMPQALQNGQLVDGTTILIHELDTIVPHAVRHVDRPVEIKQPSGTGNVSQRLLRAKLRLRTWMDVHAFYYSND